LRDQQVKTYCKRCGAVLVCSEDKWRVETPEEAERA
jgi:hypothetical protein